MTVTDHFKKLAKNSMQTTVIIILEILTSRV